MKGAPRRVLITIDEREAQRVRRRYGLTERQAVSVRQWQNGVLRGVERQPELAVDNLDLILPVLLGAKVGMITATGQSESPAALRIDPELARLSEN